MVRKNDEKTLSDSSAVEDTGYSEAFVGREPADDAGGDPSSDADLEDHCV